MNTGGGPYTRLVDHRRRARTDHARRQRTPAARLHLGDDARRHAVVLQVIEVGGGELECAARAADLVDDDLIVVTLLRQMDHVGHAHALLLSLGIGGGDGLLDVAIAFLLPVHVVADECAGPGAQEAADRSARSRVSRGCPNRQARPSARAPPIPAPFSVLFMCSQPEEPTAAFNRTATTPARIMRSIAMFTLSLRPRMGSYAGPPAMRQPGLGFNRAREISPHPSIGAKRTTTAGAGVTDGGVGAEI